jgi:hypothetical protein
MTIPRPLRSGGAVRAFYDAFFPGGQPATDFAQADVLVDRLRPLAPAEAVARSTRCVPAKRDDVAADLTR